MTIVDRLENLPPRTKLLGAVGAGAGLLVFVVRKATERNNAPPSATVAPTADLGAVSLPPGAFQDNSGGVQQNTLALVQGLITDANDKTTKLLADQSAINSKALADQQLAFTTALTSAQQAQSDKSNALQASLSAQIAALLGSGGGTPATHDGDNGGASAPVSTPVPYVPPAPAPAPIVAPAPVTTPVISGPTVSGGNGVSTAGQTIHIGDLAGWMGRGYSAIVGQLGGNNYVLGGTYAGNGQWTPGGRQEPGTVDPATGIRIPVAYNSSHDNKRWDYSTHQNAESNYSRVARQTLDLMSGHPNLSQYEASMVVLSELKNGYDKSGLNYYDSGFDFGSVPDGYGRGTYWN